jgi:hypothetical protein
MSPLSVAAAPRRTNHYLVEKHNCLAEDTWDSIADHAYPGAHAAAALQKYNTSHARASDRLRAEGSIVPGETVFIPPLAILEGHGYQPPSLAAPGTGGNP